MLQDIISYIGTLDPSVIYLILFIFAFIENVFPPSPSDLVVLVVATLIGKSILGFIPILLLTSMGSTFGFIIMYFIGEFLGEKLLRSGKLKFIKEESLKRADNWFHKYGYNLILVNRFLPGTRAVISFFSGVHRLQPLRTFIYAIVSAFIWNALLISLGMFLGKNIEAVDHYLSNYSNIILGLTVLVVIFILIRFWLKKRRSK